VGVMLQTSVLYLHGPRFFLHSVTVLKEDFLFFSSVPSGMLPQLKSLKLYTHVS
jgi:hypothetical protein